MRRALKKILFAWLVLILFSFSIGFANAALVNINPLIPGSSENYGTQEEPNPAGTIANLYQFTLMIGGLMAFVMIVYGAVKYTASGGNSSIQSDAKDRITQALIGLALLVGAALILSTISPKFNLEGGNLTIPGITDLVNPTDENALVDFGFDSQGDAGQCSPPGSPCSCGGMGNPGICSAAGTCSQCQ